MAHLAPSFAFSVAGCIFPILRMITASQGYATDGLRDQVVLYAKATHLRWCHPAEFRRADTSDADRDEYPVT